MTITRRTMIVAVLVGAMLMIALACKAWTLLRERDGLKARAGRFCGLVRGELEAQRFDLAGDDPRLRSAAADRLFRSGTGHTGFEELVLCGALSDEDVSWWDASVTCREYGNYACLALLARSVEQSIAHE